MKRFTAILMMVALLGSFSCKKSDDDGVIDPITGVQVGNQAIDFIETAFPGLSFTLSSLRGKVILLNLSAMWCGPCQSEAGELMDIYEKYKDQGFEIVQCIFEDEDGQATDMEDLGRWIARFGITFTVVNDADDSTVNAYEVSYIPLNLVIDRDFVIRYRASGFSRTAIENMINSLL